MRRIFIAGAALAIAVCAVNRAIGLLNLPDDGSVAEGYFILLAVVSVSSGLLYRIGRRL
jgi:hypothetical protein